jgi:hypothetical protein
MNWSEYSCFVGDIFGAPLALQALLAFFLESSFLGVWIFGEGKIPNKMHLASICLVAPMDALDDCVALHRQRLWLGMVLLCFSQPGQGREAAPCLLIIRIDPYDDRTGNHTRRAVLV